MTLEIILGVAFGLYLVIDWLSYLKMKRDVDFFVQVVLYQSMFLDNKFPSEYLKGDASK